MADIASIDFLKITLRWGKRAFSDTLLTLLVQIYLERFFFLTYLPIMNADQVE